MTKQYSYVAVVKDLEDKSNLLGRVVSYQTFDDLVSDVIKNQVVIENVYSTTTGIDKSVTIAYSDNLIIIKRTIPEGKIIYKYIKRVVSPHDFFLLQSEIIKNK